MINSKSCGYTGPSGIFASGYPGIDKYASEEQTIQERNAERTEQATKILVRAAEDCAKLKIPPGHVTYHGLPALGGASGVAESLVQHTKLKEHVLMVLSNRGTGATTEGASSEGLGSVSKHCVRNVPYATIIVPSTPAGESGEADGPEGDTAMKVDSPTRVCICVDGSEISAVVLSFVARHFSSASGVELHLVCVAAAQQLPALDEASMAELSGPAAHDVEKHAAAAVRTAERACSNSLEFLQGSGIAADQVRHSVLRQSGGAAEVAEAVGAYCREHSISLCVVGSHGNGVAAAEAPQRLVGLGSVADLVLSALACATCILRPQQLAAAQQQQPQQQQPPQDPSNTFPPA